MCKSLWKTSSSRPTKQPHYSTTCAKPSRRSTNTESSSTQRSAHSAYRRESYLAIWSLPKESRQTPRKSKPSPACKNQPTSKEYNSSLETRNPKPLHQQAGRTHAAFLSAAQERREIRVDGGSPPSIRGPEKTLSTPPILAVPKE